MNISPDADKRLEWYQSFVPSTVIFHRIQTGEQVREPSLVALELGQLPQKPVWLLRGSESGALPLERCLAVGNGALAYRDSPGAAVFSPLRHGQIADYTAAQHLFRTLFRRVRPKSPVSALLKPVLCVHLQEHTTEVEERALTDAAIQMGARRVLLYRDSLPAMLDRARSDAKLRNGYILHIEPQE